MDAMPRPRRPHLHRQVSRHGATVWYVRKGHGPRVRLHERFGSPEFEAEYVEAVSGAAKAPPKATGTLRWAWDCYRKESQQWGSYKPATRRQRENIMRAALKAVGDTPLVAFTPASIEKARDRRAATPHAANNLLKAFRPFFAWCLKEKLVRADPTKGVDLLSGENDEAGFMLWPECDLEKFERYWPVGTKPRLAYALVLYTGLRRGDAVRLGKQHVRNGELSIRTEKSRKGRAGTLITLPILPPLQEALDATPIGDLTFLVTEKGTPFVKESFGNWFRERCQEAGCPGSAHGLRKSGATRAADNGATIHQLMAMFGWTTEKMALHYTREADRKKLSRMAAGTLLKGDTGNVYSLTSTQGEGGGAKKAT